MVSILPLRFRGGAVSGDFIDDNGVTSFIDENSVTSFIDDNAIGSGTNFADAEIKATGANTKRTDKARYSDILNVKDFGAVGDGSHDDRTAIQNALDAAFGTAASPNANGGSINNKPVFFPAGQYNVSGPLTVTEVWGGKIFGCGSRSTVLHYAGTASRGTGGFTSLFEATQINYFEFNGITFDIPDAADPGAAVGYLQQHNVASSNSGTGCHFFDCGFKNATTGCLLGRTGGNTASENMFTSCWWDNCNSGLLTAISNALNETVIGGTVSNCSNGLYASQGCIQNVLGVRFINNSTYDVIQGNGYTQLIAGCYSNSPNMVTSFTPVYMVGCYLSGSAGNIGYMYSGGTMVCDSTISTNGVFTCDNAGNHLFTAGCSFGNPAATTFTFTPNGGGVGITTPPGGQII